MLDILRAYGVPEKLVAAIGNTYENTVTHVTTSDGITDDFKIQARVLQGDTLAPFLFVTVLDYALRKALHGNEDSLGLALKTSKSRRIGPQIISDLDFADDIALLADSLSDAEELLHLVETAALTVGLSMNAKNKLCNRARYWSYQGNGLQYGCIPIQTLDGSELEVVDDFKYLGAWISSSEKDFNIRKAQAWRACNSMNKIWKSSLLFTTTVESVLIYQVL
ncbi:uncharacterized protein [Amphiura filiformis]|uniref:uncharacterized protein n=1 Tax=Amphiura filiformis TaxID=82378 RepID=UPI003B21C5ED